MKKSLLFTVFLIFIVTQISTAQITFEKIQDFTFNDDISYLRGISWIDVDNDYDLDVFVSGSSGIPPDTNNESAIFLNDGQGNFTESNLLSTAQLGTFTHGWADIENDGDLDVYIAATWNFGGINELWLNDGGTGFTQVTNSGATPNTAAPYEGTVSWGDYDADGYVDLFLARWNLQSNIVYRNNGDGTFSSVNLGELTTDGLWTSGGIWGDYDNDGDLDIYVFNYQDNTAGPGRNDLFENNGDGTFTKNTTAGDVVTDAHNTRVANWVDANNDGYMDLFATNQNAPDRLYLNNGDGTFSSQSINESGTSWSSNWGDYDNDGDEDLIIMGASPDESVFFQNDGQGGLTNINAEHSNIFPLPFSGSLSNGVMFADYDNDGWLDLHLTQPNTAPDLLFHNNGADCISWIKIKCTGIESNWAGIGTTIRALSNIGGNDVWQMRQISAQTSKPGQNPMWAHFGFQDAGQIDSLIIEWPSGAVCAYSDVAVNQFVEIFEDCSIQAIIAAPDIPGETSEVTLCEGDDDVQLESPSGNLEGEWSASCDDCINEEGLFLASGLSAGEYQAYYTDGGICGFRDTIFINIYANPTIVAMGDTTIFTGEQAELSASGASTYTWSPSENLSCSECDITIFSGQDTTILFVTGMTEEGCIGMDSVIVNVNPTPVFGIPNIFTPNGDGVNDVFNVVSHSNELLFESFELVIYNRWGEKVFETTSAIEGWDGKHNDKPAVTEVYFYALSYELINGEAGNEQGNFTLAR